MSELKKKRRRTQSLFRLAASGSDVGIEGKKPGRKFFCGMIPRLSPRFSLPSFSSFLSHRPSVIRRSLKMSLQFTNWISTVSHPILQLRYTLLLSFSLFCSLLHPFLFSYVSFLLSLLSSGHPKIIEDLIAVHKLDIHCLSNDNSTPLHFARSAGAVKVLLRFGADVTKVTARHATPLHILARYASAEVKRK